ncbi:hypothetical protein BDV18DRAFT_152673 [Aspergillus unguis]
MTSRRVTRPRSRNGCITCKIRHVKCDEAKPECLQCQKSGRKCDGYDNASQTELRQRIAERHKPIDRDTFGADHRIVLRQETKAERRYFDFFHTKTSHAFSGFYDSRLWSYLIPQFGEYEPSVRHAMTAIGAFHAKAQRAAVKDGLVTTEAFVLEEYNKSIQTLVKSLSGRTESIDLTLTACCLFVCLEMLRQNQKEALDHIQAGLRIIHNYEQTSSRFSELYRQLRDLFLRLNLQASFMGRLMVPLKICSSEIVRSGLLFSDMQESRNYLDQLITKALLFIRFVGKSRVVRDPVSQLNLEEEQKEIHQDMLSWRWSHDNLLSKLGPKIQYTDLCASLLQRIYYHAGLIWALVVLERTEDDYDNYTSDFEAIIDYAEEIVRLAHSQKTEPETETFSLEGEIIGPLYYTACRCRHPFVRRRALNILLHYSKREGMWDAQLCVAISKLFIEIEESQCITPPMSEKDIGTLDRVYDEVLKREPRNKPVLATFYMKPEGVDGPWSIRNIMVDW